MIDRAVVEDTERHSAVRLALEGIFLRRRLRFWRRAAWGFGGLTLVVLAIAWQRFETAKTECTTSLQFYAAKAHDQQLDKAPLDMINTMWMSLEAPEARRLPAHYELIRANWNKPGDDAGVPLAVCLRTHTMLFGSGRNVLFRTKTGYDIRWIPEDEVQQYLHGASRVFPAQGTQSAQR